MVLFKSSYTDEPSLIAHAIEEGFCELGYERIKPKQMTAVESLLIGHLGRFISVPTGFCKSLMHRTLPFCSKCLSTPARCHECPKVQLW